ncbi:hypothetical protein E2C01_058142 [Portunus trituberculatus]|uniref:Uncharacterized protein n=1 Tax=Portunus trituberculatus TaxID=210409 RepID=A0A5B7GZ19_PORTR|nr:hypothetical protein [Portunus trituberculatus]
MCLLSRGGYITTELRDQTAGKHVLGDALLRLLHPLSPPTSPLRYWRGTPYPPKLRPSGLSW